MRHFFCRESRTHLVCFAAAAVAAVTVAAPARAQTSWNAYNDFYLSPTAAGWGGATSPSATGAAWGQYMGNVNGVGGFPSNIGTYLSTSQLYRFSSVNPLGVSGTVRSQSFWDDTGGAGFARYVDNVDWNGTGVGTVPHSSLGSYSTPWFVGAPGLGDGPGGSDLTNLIWLQSAFLSGTSSPSGEGIASVLTWTAPATRTYDFYGLFVSGNSPSQSAAVAITDSLGGTAPLSRTVLANDAVRSFSFSKAYTAGDVVQFQVGNNLSSGNVVGLQVSIVPEPSTWVMGLAGIGCAGWGAFRRRKRAVRHRAVAHPAAMLAVLFIALLTNPAHAAPITIDMVTVGNAGNLAQSSTNAHQNGYGAIAYVYQIGKYDVTIG